MDTLGIRSDLILLLLTSLLTFVLYPFWIWFVYKFHMGEVTRIHAEKEGTPTMGGLVFVLAVSIVTILLNRSRTQTLLPLFIANLAGLLGILEDLTKVYSKSNLPYVISYYFRWTIIFSRFFGFVFKPFIGIWNKFKEFSYDVGSSTGTGIDTYKKFLIQGFMAGLIAYWTYFKLGWDYIWLPLVGNIHIGIFYPLMVFFLFIVVLNAVAFTDGLDGLAGGLSLIAFVAFWAISRVVDYNSLAGFCATFIGALIPFLYFNVYPARIFMGNVGSHVLGAVLATLAILLHREVAFLVIGLVFLVDGVSSPLQQYSVKITGKRLLLSAPFHHHFERLGWPEAKVTFRFWLFGIFFACLGVLIALL